MVGAKNYANCVNDRLGFQVNSFKMNYKLQYLKRHFNVLNLIYFKDKMSHLFFFQKKALRSKSFNFNEISITSFLWQNAVTLLIKLLSCDK